MNRHGPIGTGIEGAFTMHIHNDDIGRTQEAMSTYSRHDWHRALRITAWLAFLLPAWPLLAAPAGHGTTFDAPVFQGDVLDPTGTLGEADQALLRERIRTLRDEDGVWAAVYVAPSLQHDSIEQAAVKVFEKWQLGQKGKDNGLLVLIAPTERKMRIEVGYGLEGTLTDAFSKHIIDDIYKPAFRENRFTEGLMQGFDAMARAMRGEASREASIPVQQQPPADREMDWSRAGQWAAIAFVANLLPALLYALAVIYGRSQGRSENRYLWREISGPIYIFGFLAVFFALFAGVFGGAGDISEDMAVPAAASNALFIGLIGIPFGINARRYLSASAYRRYRARQRLFRIRRRSRVPREVFGVWFDPADVGTSQGGTRRESSSSSSSSGSSGSSSSSGGGSSGGGGASGSW
jgi:uncharacterized protein